ncbi:MAG TPA: hypothetical protein VGM50_19185 [Gemmatimonadaceae bacterium]|jgi:hypothetical protein
MLYTVWSRGRLLGESELEYARYAPLSRGGGFWPTVAGAKLMPVVTGVRTTSVVLGRKSRELTRADGTPPDSGPEFESYMIETTEYADYIAAIDRLNALELELRDPHGNVVPNEWVDIRDMDFLSDLEMREVEAEDEASMLVDGYDPELEEAVAHDMIVLGLAPDPLSNEPFVPREWSDHSDLARRPFPPFQILVRLLDEKAIP